MTSLLARHPLVTIVIAQLFGTSLWFSVNGVGLALQQAVGLSESDLGLLTIAVQAGFITGTLTIATTGLADRVRASHLFALSAVLGALINAAFITVADNVTLAAMARFATGLCLAGIYPLGMKLVVSWTPTHAGAALGWLVGMLTLGTASPHLLRGVTLSLPWQWPLLLASCLALCAASMIFRLGVGPHLPATAKGGRPWAGLLAFQQRGFRSAALGYFGHCWELYAFWTLTPFLVARELARLRLTRFAFVRYSILQRSSPIRLHTPPNPPASRCCRSNRATLNGTRPGESPHRSRQVGPIFPPSGTLRWSPDRLVSNAAVPFE
mgnify:CR=1 FL=1